MSQAQKDVNIFFLKRSKSPLAKPTKLELDKRTADKKGSEYSCRDVIIIGSDNVCTDNEISITKQEPHIFFKKRKTNTFALSDCNEYLTENDKSISAPWPSFRQSSYIVTPCSQMGFQLLKKTDSKSLCNSNNQNINSFLDSFMSKGTPKASAIFHEQERFSPRFPAAYDINREIKAKFREWLNENIETSHLNNFDAEKDCIWMGYGVDPMLKKKAFLLSGPVGSGKTCFIQQAAQDLGVILIENNPFTLRSGKTLIEAFGSAIISKSIKPKTVILIEEFENIYKEDKQFISGLKDLIVKSKIPIVITTNVCLSALNSLNLPSIQMECFAKYNAIQTFLHYFPNPAHDGWSLSKFKDCMECNGDLRKLGLPNFSLEYSDKKLNDKLLIGMPNISKLSLEKYQRTTELMSFIDYLNIHHEMENSSENDQCILFASALDRYSEQLSNKNSFYEIEKYEYVVSHLLVAVVEELQPDYGSYELIKFACFHERNQLVRERVGMLYWAFPEYSSVEKLERLYFMNQINANSRRSTRNLSTSLNSNLSLSPCMELLKENYNEILFTDFQFPLI